MSVEQTNRVENILYLIIPLSLHKSYQIIVYLLLVHQLSQFVRSVVAGPNTDYNTADSNYSSFHYHNLVDYNCFDYTSLVHSPSSYTMVVIPNYSVDPNLLEIGHLTNCLVDSIRTVVILGNFLQENQSTCIKC